MTTTQTPVDAAVEHMLQFDRFYRLNLWPANGTDDRRHDLNVMWRHNDLDTVTTELHTAAGAVLLEFAIAFRGSAPAPLAAWPLLDRRTVAGGRLLVQRRGSDAAYRHLLRLEWNPAAPRPKLRADDLPSGDTGGGQVRVGADQRRPLVVTRTGPRFSFANRTDDPAAAHVFLLPQFAPAGWLFQVGQRLTALLVVTPGGVQARAIRPA